MQALIKILGIFILAAGTLILIYPKYARRMMQFWKQGRNIYLAGSIRVILGVFLMFGSCASRMPWVIFTLGLITFFGGLFIFFLGREKTAQLISKIESKPDSSLRLLFPLILAFGVLIIISA